MPREGNYGPISQTDTGDYASVCETCGKEFRTDSPRQIYCSPGCKRRRQNRRYYRTHRRNVITRVLRNRGSHADN